MKWLDDLKSAWKNDPWERVLDAAIAADDEELTLRLINGQVDDEEMQALAAKLDGTINEALNPNSAFDEWKVSVQGRPNESYEISVVRTSFPHGFKSRGWGGAEKIIISGEDRIDAFLFNELTNVATRYAAHLNDQERTNPRTTKGMSRYDN